MQLLSLPHSYEAALPQIITYHGTVVAEKGIKNKGEQR